MPNDSESSLTDVRDRIALVVNALQEKKAANIRIMQMGELIGVTEYFVICSALNPVHLKAVAAHIKNTLGDHGIRPRHEEGLKVSQWVLQDYADFVVHLFLDGMRAHYDIENLWSDAPDVPLEELVPADPSG